MGPFSMPISPAQVGPFCMLITSKLRLERLRFKAMLLWLLHVAEALLGIADETLTERPGKPRVNVNQQAGRNL